MVLMIQLPPPENEHQRSVSNFWSCILNNLWAMDRSCPIFNLSAAIMRQNASDDISTASWKWASTDRLWFFVLHCRQSKGFGTSLSHIQLISCLCGDKCYWRHCVRLLQFSAHRPSTIFVGVQSATQQWTALCCSWIESHAVSLCIILLYTTSQICLQCLTDLIILWL